MAATQEAVEVDEEGYLIHPEDWTPELALEIAAKIGLELEESHWKVIHFMRKTYLDSGSAPSMRTLGKESGVSTKELYQIFPSGPAKIAAKIAGIPKPRGCI